MNEGGGGTASIKYGRNGTRKTPEMVFRRVEILPQQNSNQTIFSNIQQIKDIYLQDTEKVSKEKLGTSVLGFASSSDSLQMSPTLSTLVSDDTLMSLHTSESIGGLSRRLNSVQNLDESSSSTCDISELNATITPVNLIEESEGLMLVGPPITKDVFSVPKPLFKDSPPPKYAKDCVSNGIASNRLLDKIMQNCKPESNFTLPLKVSEYGKLPPMGLKSNFSYAKSPEHPIYEKINLSTNCTSAPMSIDVSRQDMRTMGTLKDSYTIGPPAIMTTAMTQQETQYCLTMNTPMQYSQAALHSTTQPSTKDVFLNANCVVSPSHSRHAMLSSVEHNTKKIVDCKNSYHLDGISKRTNPHDQMLLHTETLFSASPISSSNNDSSQNLYDANILSQINELASQTAKDSRTFRQVDIMLSQMQPNGENVLNLCQLTNSLSTDMCQQNSTVAVDQALNVGLTIEENHLADLAPSPLLNTISPDFLDNNSVISKTSPGQQTFLPNLSTTTDLALSFSTNFLENSNMSIDMGSLSEGEGSLNIAHGFVESLDTANEKKPCVQLNFTNALKDAADKYDSAKLEKLAQNLESRQTKPSSVSTEIKLNLAPIPRNDAAACKRRKVSPVKVRSVIEAQRQREIMQKMEDKPVVQQVQCLKCSVCSFLTLDESEMFVHMKSKHNKEDKKTANSRPPIIHKPTAQSKKEIATKTTEAKSKPTRRNKQNHYVDSNSNSTDHEASDSSEADVKDELYSPNDEDTNGSNSTNEEAALKHEMPLRKTVDPEAVYRCGVNGCNFRMKEELNMEYHRKCHYNAFLMCPECSMKFAHWALLATHLWKEHYIDMELHSCDLCNYKSYSYTKLVNNHRSTHSNERPFLCDVCGKDFKTAKQLRSHKTLHQEKKEFQKCDMCNRKFFEKRMLLGHLEAVHNKVKPYLCNFCGKSFASKSTLILHIRKHTGEKPFSCDKCNYCTSDHNSMRRHKMKHSNDKRYSCPYCDYSSIQSSTFKVHLKRKHDAQAQKDGLIFTCMICTFKTVKRDNFLAHIAIHRKTTDNVPDKSKPTAKPIPSSAEKPNLKKRKRSTKAALVENSSNASNVEVALKEDVAVKAEIPITGQNQNQCPQAYYVVQMPHVVNINWDTAEAVEVPATSDVLNGIILPTRGLSSQIVQVGSVDEFDSNMMQQVDLNNGYVQLTPEVVAVPISNNSTTPSNSSLPGIIYVSTEEETPSTSV